MPLFIVALWVLLSRNFRAPRLNIQLLVPSVIIFILSMLHLAFGLHRLISVSGVLIALGCFLTELYSTQMLIYPRHGGKHSTSNISSKTLLRSMI